MSSSPTRFRAGSLIHYNNTRPEWGEVAIVYGILYKRCKLWYVFWADDGFSHQTHNGNARKVCRENFEEGVWKLIVY